MGKLKTHYELLGGAACGKLNVEKKTKVIERLTCTKCMKYAEVNHIITKKIGY